MKSLVGSICLVTGATRGIGKGIAVQLGAAGATVYVTGRTLEPRQGDGVGGSLKETVDEIKNRGGVGIPVQCDHGNAKEIEGLFERIKQEQSGKLDVVVNSAYAAVNALMENAGKPFWETDPGMWDLVNNVGLRGVYLCNLYAARIMVPRRSGLIVNVSSGGGLRYLFNVAYGVGKQGLDRMAADMAHELKRHNVTCISLWPGAVKTEIITDLLDKNNKAVDMFKEGESTEYSGLAVAALASDPNVFSKTGRILMTGELGSEYGFKDIDGRQISSMRSLKTVLRFLSWQKVADWVPAWVKIPYFVLTLSGSKF